MNNLEKQIQVETKDQKKLSKQDINDIDIINNFLTLHEASNQEENEKTIINSGDQEVIKAWNNLLRAMEKRLGRIKNIEFVDINNYIFSIDTKYGFFKFSDMKNFNPPVGNKKHDIPKELDAYLQNNNPRAGTSGLKEGKEGKKDISKIKNNIKNFYNNNKSILEENFGIKDIGELTPQQAILFCTYFTISKLDYDYLQVSVKGDGTLNDKYIGKLSENEQKEYKENPSEFIKRAQEHANIIDNASLSDLIKKHGTGVCRNYADLMTGTFEAVKSLQKGKINALSNMYCSSTMSETTYNNAINNLIVDRHARNTFFYVSKNNVESIIIDATRADATQKDKDTDLGNISYSDRFLFDIEEMEKMKLITHKEKIERFEQYIKYLTPEQLTTNVNKAILYQIFDYYRITGWGSGELQREKDMKEAFTYGFMIEDFDPKNTLLRQDLFTLGQKYPNEYKEIRDQKKKPEIIAKVQKKIESSKEICILRNMGLEDSEWPDILPLLKKFEIIQLDNNKQLNNNKFQEIPQELLSLPNLKCLNMGNNQINKFPENIENSNIEVLGIQSNKFETFPIGIYKLTKLKSLYIDDNYFERIPEDINTMTNLKSLYIDNDRLNYIPTSILQNDKITGLEKYKENQQLEFAKDRIIKSLYRNKEIISWNIKQTGVEVKQTGIEVNLSDLLLKKDDRMDIIKILDSHSNKKFLLNIDESLNNRIYYPDNKNDLLDIVNKT